MLKTIDYTPKIMRVKIYIFGSDFIWRMQLMINKG